MTPTKKPEIIMLICSQDEGLLRTVPMVVRLSAKWTLQCSASNGPGRNRNLHKSGDGARDEDKHKTEREVVLT